MKNPAYPYLDKRDFFHIAKAPLRIIWNSPWIESCYLHRE